MRVLIVDDEVASRKKLESIMHDFGECVPVETGTEALAEFQEAWNQWRPFDLITLDISMPEMDGTEVLHRIRELEAEKGVAEEKKANIFIVTGQTDKNRMITAIRGGCNDFIRKPYKRLRILEKLEECGLVDPFKTDETTGS